MFSDMKENYMEHECHNSGGHDKYVISHLEIISIVSSVMLLDFYFFLK